MRRPDGDVEIPVRRPDGDVELRTAGTSFKVPPCAKCGGILKPYVVFFGDQLPKDRSARSVQEAPFAMHMHKALEGMSVWSQCNTAVEDLDIEGQCLERFCLVIRWCIVPHTMHQSNDT